MTEINNPRATGFDSLFEGFDQVSSFKSVFSELDESSLATGVFDDLEEQTTLAETIIGLRAANTLNRAFADLKEPPYSGSAFASMRSSTTFDEILDESEERSLHSILNQLAARTGVLDDLEERTTLASATIGLRAVNSLDRAFADLEEPPSLINYTSLGAVSTFGSALGNLEQSISQPQIAAAALGESFDQLAVNFLDEITVPSEPIRLDLATDPQEQTDHVTTSTEKDFLFLTAEINYHAARAYIRDWEAPITEEEAHKLYVLSCLLALTYATTSATPMTPGEALATVIFARMLSIAGLTTR